VLLSDDELVRLKAVSRTVFGQELRAPVMVAILQQPQGRFTLTDIVEALGVDYPSAVQAPLAALVAAQLIEREEPQRGVRWRYYRRCDSALWAYAEELLARARREAAAARPIATVTEIGRARSS
jgi:predicted transcriptional regulator